MTAAAEDVKIPTVFDDEAADVSRSYADAFLNAAAGQADVGAAVDELEEFVKDVWVGQPKFSGLLGSDSFPAREKDRMLTGTFEGKALPIVLTFLRVLNRHGRLSHLPAITRQVRASWDRKQNRKPVLVKSAVPLDDAAKTALVERLKSLIQATPILHLEVDPSLIGGLIVQVGDDVYDASVRTRLTQLRHRLIESQTHEIQSRRDHFSHSA